MGFLGALHPHLLQFQPVRSHLLQFQPVRSHLLQFQPVRSHLLQFQQFQPVRLHLLQFQPVRSHLLQFQPVRSHLWSSSPRVRTYSKGPRDGDGCGCASKRIATMEQAAVFAKAKPGSRNEWLVRAGLFRETKADHFLGAAAFPSAAGVASAPSSVAAASSFFTLAFLANFSTGTLGKA